MNRWFRKLKFNKNKEGASMISVIIGVIFLSAIGVTILTVATRYLTTVYVDKNASANFYSAEGVLEEVKTGLIEYSGTAAEEAYVDIMENYTKEQNMQVAFSKKYISNIASYLIAGLSYNWDDDNEKLGEVQVCSIDMLKRLSTVPDAVKTKTLAGGTPVDLAFVINYSDEDGYTLTIKNLFIEYVNEADYITTIDTDIVFHVPDYKFEGDSTFEQLKNYIVISDNDLSVENSLIGTNFYGNVYTGEVDSGISIGTQNVVSFYSPRIISRGSLDVYSGADVSVQGESGAGELWLQNIRLKPFGADDSTLSTSFYMNENAYISNDLTIDDNYAEVSLAGKYYGYSYNKENDIASSEKADANYSSAILINGTNTLIDAKDLGKMILAGRSFVQQNDSSEEKVASDIMLGESVAPKSSQLAYLVPDSYIVIGSNASDGHNPVTVDELNDPSKMIEKNIKTALLADYSPYKDYLNQAQPYTTNYKQIGGTAVAYFFLNFKDEASANKYFKDYYNGLIEISDDEGTLFDNKEQLKEKAETYLISTDDMFNTIHSKLYLIAGNIITNYSETSGIQSANYYDDTTQKPKTQLINAAVEMALDHAGYCLALVPGGKNNRADMSSIRLTGADKKLVSDVVIDFSKVNGDIVRLASETKQGGEIRVWDGGRTLTTDMTGLLIVKGDVTVEADFTGLILASGKVTVNGNREMKADSILVGNLLEYVKTDDELAKLFYALNGAVKYDSTKLEECIAYQNWERNAE